jgi:hypothetical protein
MTIFRRETANFESAPDCTVREATQRHIRHDGKYRRRAGVATNGDGAPSERRKEAIMSTNTSRPNKATALARVQALIAGTEMHFPNGSFTLGNAAYTTATLIQALKSLENAIAVLNGAHTSVKDAGTALRDIETKVGPLMRDYKRFVLAAFSTSTQQLADFGLPPPKTRMPMTSETRAVATAKLRSTRKARGTTSRKKKLAVKGDVTGVTVTPITTAAATSTSAAPAETSSTVHAPSGTAK